MTHATHHKHIRPALHTAPATLGTALAVVAMLLLTASCRRDLYVFGDEFHSVTLDVDWREFDSSDPDGMTVWFYKLDDPEAQPFRTTTANVRRQDLYLSNATYQGVVVSYSPEEYSRQTFADMADIDKARVEATPAPYQPADLTIPGVAVAPLAAMLQERLKNRIFEMTGIRIGKVGILVEAASEAKENKPAPVEQLPSRVK